MMKSGSSQASTLVGEPLPTADKTRLRRRRSSVFLRLSFFGPQLFNSDVVFWRVPSELTSRQARLLLGKQRAKEIFCSLPELESLVRIQDQRLHECLGLLTTRFPNGFDG